MSLVYHSCIYNFNIAITILVVLSHFIVIPACPAVNLITPSLMMWGCFGNTISVFHHIFRLWVLKKKWENLITNLYYSHKHWVVDHHYFLFHRESNTLRPSRGSYYWFWIRWGEGALWLQTKNHSLESLPILHVKMSNTTPLDHIKHSC